LQHYRWIKAWQSTWKFIICIVFFSCKLQSDCFNYKKNLKMDSFQFL
jgi:hypothetical protein